MTNKCFEIMNLNRKRSVRTRLAVLLLAAFMVSGDVAAEEQTLECTLYIATSMDSDAQSGIEMKEAGLMLNSVRRSSFCVFGDGRVADKQFVMVSRAVGDGATGSSMGYSVYTMENGDSVSAQFIGDWGALQLLPAAREAINDYLIERLEQADA